MQSQFGGTIVYAFQYCIDKIRQEQSTAELLLPVSTNSTATLIAPESVGYFNAVETTSTTTALNIISAHEMVGNAAYSSHRIPEVRQILIYCYAIPILCGSTFNLAVLFALLYFREQTFTNIANIFVFTLAASDVVLCGVSMPIQLYYGIDESSSVNTALCRALFAGFGIPMYVSCLTILLIAIDRHRLIVKPTIPRVSVQTALALILTTVVFSALNAVPVGLYTESKEIKGFQSFCVETWPSAGLRLAYSVAIFMVHFMLPLVVSGGLYTEIYRRLAKRPEQLSMSQETERRKRKKRRTTTLLGCVVVCFAICWTPWCLFSLLIEIDTYVTRGASEPNVPVDLSQLTTEACTAWLTHGRLGGWAFGLTNSTGDTVQPDQGLTPSRPKSFIRGTHFTLVDMVLKVWAMGSACVNPFLYGWLNRPIREAMISLYESISAFCLGSAAAASRRGTINATVRNRRHQQPEKYVQQQSSLRQTGDDSLLPLNRNGSKQNEAKSKSTKRSLMQRFCHKKVPDWNKDSEAAFNVMETETQIPVVVIVEAATNSI